jgi:hypothetical protein
VGGSRVRTVGPPSTVSSVHPCRARRDPRAIVKPRNADRSRRQARRAICGMSGPTWTAGRDFAIENGRNAGG